jgi:hypothetical protein
MRLPPRTVKQVACVPNPRSAERRSRLLLEWRVTKRAHLNGTAALVRGYRVASAMALGVSDHT